MAGDSSPDSIKLESVLYSAKLPCAMVFVFFILNKLMGFFWDALTVGLLNFLTFWVPLIEHWRMQALCQTMKIDGKQLTFGCPRGEFFCQYMKLSFLNLITLTIYGNCCGGKKKYIEFLDSHLCWKDGSGKGNFKWFTAEVNGGWKILYVLGVLCSAFTAYPFLKLWIIKKTLAKMEFDGIVMSLEKASYCTYAKKFMTCGDVKGYLDSVVIIKKKSLVERVKEAAEGAAGA
eukprot:Hpha_TRINITY_DN16293_c2_g4::TRINITY_DN16293_c2_g4_i1::g.14372::m.14372